jgi:hypothetical protein
MAGFLSQSQTYIVYDVRHRARRFSEHVLGVLRRAGILVLTGRLAFREPISRGWVVKGHRTVSPWVAGGNRASESKSR